MNTFIAVYLVHPDGQPSVRVTNTIKNLSEEKIEKLEEALNLVNQYISSEDLKLHVVIEFEED